MIVLLPIAIFHTCLFCAVGWLWPTLDHVSQSRQFEKRFVSNFDEDYRSPPIVYSSEEAKRLYEDIVTHHNHIVRPVRVRNDTVDVYIKLKLSQIISVLEKQQIVATNVWVLQEWYDVGLTWNPADYGGIEYMYVPSQMIWLPDIVLYNNADGKYQLTMFTKATVYHTGRVVWEPPAIYKSYCEMDIEWFPYDEQICHLKFGFWSYDGLTSNLVHWRGNDVNISKDEAGFDIWTVDRALDLSSYYPSVEWEIIDTPAVRHSAKYPCCEAPFVDVTYTLHIRRKTLFYTVNMVVPCLGISYLTILVFYLPADSQEKITLCISILLALTVFFLLLAEQVPSTSLVVPLVGKYLIFTMTLVTGSVAITIATMNVYYKCRTRTITPRMSQWVREWFLDRLPRLLFMKRFQVYEWRPRGMTDMLLKAANNLQYSMQMYAKAVHAKSMESGGDSGDLERKASKISRKSAKSRLPPKPIDREIRLTKDLRDKLEHVAVCVNFIAEKIRRENHEVEMAEEWRYVAMVVDKVFLYIYVISCICGTYAIILRAPIIYDKREAIA